MWRLFKINFNRSLLIALSLPSSHVPLLHHSPTASHLIIICCVYPIASPVAWHHFRFPLCGAPQSYPCWNIVVQSYSLRIIFKLVFILLYTYCSHSFVVVFIYALTRASIGMSQNISLSKSSNKYECGLSISPVSVLVLSMDTDTSRSVNMSFKVWVRLMVWEYMNMSMY